MIITVSARCVNSMDLKWKYSERVWANGLAMYVNDVMYVLCAVSYVQKYLNSWWEWSVKNHLRMQKRKWNLSELWSLRGSLPPFLSLLPSLSPCNHLYTYYVHTTWTSRYPHLACELLTAEVYTIVEKLSSSESLLQLLWSFLDSSSPLDPLVGSFISKVLAMLLNKENINSVVSLLACLVFSQNIVQTMASRVVSVPIRSGLSIPTPPPPASPLLDVECWHLMQFDCFSFLFWI